MRTSSRIFINAASSWIAKLSSSILGVILVPFLLGQFGREGYGLVGLATSVVVFAGLADFGLRDALSRELAEQVARRRSARFNALLSTAMALYLAIGGTLMLIIIAIAPQAARWVNVPPHLWDQGVFLIRWYAGGEILLTFIRPIFGSILSSHNRHDLANRIHMVSNLTRGVLVLVLLSVTQSGLYGYTGVILTVLAIEIVLLFFQARRLHPGFRIRPRLVTRRAARSLIGLSKYIFPLRVGENISVQADPFILTAFFGPAAVALYTPAAALSRLSQPIVNTLANQLAPLATRYHSVGERENLQQVLVRGTKYTLLMGIPVCVVLGVFAGPIMYVWLQRRLGEDYAIVAQILMWYVLADVFLYAGGTQWPVFVATKRLGFLICVSLPLAVLNVLGSIAMVGYTSLGVVGVVIPTAIVNAIRRPIISAYIARVAGLRPWDYFLRSYLGPLMMAMVLTGGALLMRFLLPVHSLPWLLGAAAGVAVLAVPAGWVFALDADDRRGFRDLARNGWKAARARLKPWLQSRRAPDASPPADEVKAVPLTEEIERTNPCTEANG